MSNVRQFMSKTGIIILALITLFVGYRLGKQSDGQSSAYTPTYTSPSYSSSTDYSDSEEKLEELRSSLEDARDNAEQARDAADEVEHQARMRWLETGSLEDQMRMHDAEDAASQANDAVDSIENSISNAE